MVFDDVFYPGNPKKRQEIAELRAEIVYTVTQYQSAWNDNAKTMNEALKQAAKPGSPFYNISLPLLSKDITKDKVGECLTEINDALDTARATLDNLVTDIGLDKNLPKDWAEKGIKLDDLDDRKVLDIVKKIEVSLAGVGTAVLSFYVFRGAMVAFGLIAAITGVLKTLTAILGGALAGAIVGGAVFVITDMIASAITGAIERKELKKAIEPLTELRDAVKPLQNGATELRSITRSIKDGAYRLADGYVLIRNSDGTYVLFGSGGAIHTIAA